MYLFLANEELLKNTKTSAVCFIKEENCVNNERKICTFCGEDIAADFKRCPYCGSLLDIKPSFSENEENKPDSMKNVSYGFEAGNQGDKPDYYGAGEKINESVFKEEPLGDHNYYAEPENKMEKEPEFGERAPEFRENTPAFQESISGDTEPVGSKSSLSGSIMPDSGLKQVGSQYNLDLNKSTVNKPPISNGMKVFLTSICNLVPGLGQIAGVIIAVVLMNTEGDEDRKSFGFALLITSLIVFVLTGISCCILLSIISNLLNPGF